MLVFVHRRDRTNIGDWSCCPADYLPVGDHHRVDICALDRHADLLRAATSIVIGGGGLFYFAAELDLLLGLPGRKIGWGIGTNTHGATGPTYPVDLGRFDRLGLRDGGPDWVPCASALAPEFDRPRPACRDVVVYEHKDHPLGLPYPTAQNSADSLARVVDFLSSGAVVVTNSYHGWYWATLLGRAVVVYRPFSSRFYALPWPCPVAHTEPEMSSALASAEPVLGALATARDRNRAFHRAVL